jgi:hypothetical protein
VRFLVVRTKRALRRGDDEWRRRGHTAQRVARRTI